MFGRMNSSIAPRWRGAVFLLLGPWTWSLTAHSLVPLAIEELTRHADVVVRGTVLSKRCQRDHSGRIYTQVKLHAKEYWKGEGPLGPALTIVHGGGILGQYRSRVSNQVSYGLGEEVVAFLIRNSRGEAVTLGLCQGKFEIWQDPSTGEHYARNPFHGTNRIDRNPELLQSRERPLKLGDLKLQVQGGTR